MTGAAVTSIVNEERVHVCVLQGKNWRLRHDGITAYRAVRYIKHDRLLALPQNGDAVGHGGRTAEEVRVKKGVERLSCRIQYSYGTFGMINRPSR